MKLGLTTTSRSVPRPQTEVATAADVTPSMDRPATRAEQTPAREDVLVTSLPRPSSDEAPASAGVLESTTKLIRRETLTGTGRHAKIDRAPVPPPSSMPASDKAPSSARGVDKPPTERRRRPRK